MEEQNLLDGIDFVMDEEDQPQPRLTAEEEQRRLLIAAQAAAQQQRQEEEAELRICQVAE